MLVYAQIVFFVMVIRLEEQGFSSENEAKFGLIGMPGGSCKLIKIMSSGERASSYFNAWNCGGGTEAQPTRLSHRPAARLYHASYLLFHRIKRTQKLSKCLLVGVLVFWVYSVSTVISITDVLGFQFSVSVPTIYIVCNYYILYCGAHHALHQVPMVMRQRQVRVSCAIVPIIHCTRFLWQQHKEARDSTNGY